MDRSPQGSQIGAWPLLRSSGSRNVVQHVQLELIQVGLADYGDAKFDRPISLPMGLPRSLDAFHFRSALCAFKQRLQLRRDALLRLRPCVHTSVDIHGQNFVSDHSTV
jgi:hypothetical protein